MLGLTLSALTGLSNATRRLQNSANNLANVQTSGFKKGEVIKNVDVCLGNKPTINLVIKEDVISILSFDQIKLIEASINYNKPIDAPIKNGDKLGNIILNIPGKDKIDVPLVAQNDIKEVNPLMKSFAAIKYLIFGTSLDEKK